MRIGIRRALASLAAALMTAFGVAVPGGRPAVAGPCERVVFVNSEISVNEGVGRLIFSVFSGGCGAPGDVSYVATSGTARSPSDFTLASGRLNWKAGDTTVRKIVVTVVNDGVDESDLEDFTVTLTSSHRDIKVAVPSAHGRIVDNDGLGLVWVVDDQICPVIPVDTTQPPGVPWLTGEQKYLCDFEHGVVNALPVGPHPTTETITWGTVDGSAYAGVDFIGVVGKVEYVPAGAPFAELTVTMLSRPPGTPIRWFLVRVAGVSEGRIVDGTAVVTIGVQ